MTATNARAMILAAGFGTRLGPLTALRPKPMLPVCGAPLVRWAVLWLRSQGVREFVINLHHMGEQIEQELGNGATLGVAIVYSRESEILGTGGGLRQARPWLDDGTGRPIVIVNGKILLELNLDEVLRSHRARKAEATMVLRGDLAAERWGSFRLDAAGQVAEFLGVGGPKTPSSPPLMFTGVHVIQPQFLDRIPPQGAQCIIRSAYQQLFTEAGPLFGFVSDRYWWEHSTLERYLQGVRNVLDGRVALPYAEGPVVGIDPHAVLGRAQVVAPVWIGAGVRVRGAPIIGPHVQLGSDVSIEGDVRVARSVVWPGGSVARDLDGDVVVS